jgi:hypothetical protein
VSKKLYLSCQCCIFTIILRIDHLLKEFASESMHIVIAEDSHFDIRVNSNNCSVIAAIIAVIITDFKWHLHNTLSILNNNNNHQACGFSMPM